MIFEVIVQLKGEVLDPEARAIHETLERQGIEGVRRVSVSKRYLLEVDSTLNDKAAQEQVQMIAESYLANPVSEEFQVKRAPL